MSVCSLALATGRSALAHLTLILKKIGAQRVLVGAAPRIYQVVDRLICHLDSRRSGLRSGNLWEPDHGRRSGYRGVVLVYRVMYGDVYRKFGYGSPTRPITGNLLTGASRRTGVGLSYRGRNVLRDQACGPSGTCRDMGLGGRVV